MNVIEKAIGLISPSWGASRAENRYLMNQYDGLTPNQGVAVKRDSNEMDKLTASSQKPLAEAARYYEKNDPLFAASVDEVVKNTIGTGLKIHPQPKNADGTINKPFAKQLKRLIKKHDRHFEMDGRTTRGEAEQLAMRHMFRDGEVFAHMVSMGGHDYLGSVPFGVQLIPFECIDPTMTIESQGIVNGIKYGKWNRPESYMFKANPKGTAKPVPLPAENIIHLRLTKQIRQGRGHSAIAPALRTIRDVDAYFESIKIKFLAAAKMSVVHKRGREKDNNQRKKDQNPRDFKLGYGGNKITIDKDDELTILESKNGAPEVKALSDLFAKKITSALGVSNSSTTAEYIKSFTAQRQELLDRWAGYVVLRNKVAEGLTRPCYEKLVGISVLTGALKIPSELDRDTLYDADITGAAQPWIDPLKEANSLKVLNAMGAKSLTRILAERNVDVEAELNAYHEEQKMMKQLGLSFNKSGDLVDENKESNDDDESASTGADGVKDKADE
ncbi:phage portal protein [Vibrio hannami]|uniref:phage portal protein n=1 Tax=Vibrio hannami TaxID=2717094 RepID=UPI002410904E|nr:phage portal protein [Vibrio hannami]MDG3089119.1 phage portal protein [Vibrio hannami]